jgi:predicted HicB family RNase H-like nuclease
VKTTLDFSDNLHARAKSEAARLQMPLTRFIEQAVERQLNQSAQPALSVKSVELPVFRLGLKSAYQGISLNQFYDQLEAETNSSRL